MRTSLLMITLVFIEKSKTLEEEAGYWKTHHIETGAIASGLSLVQGGRKVLKESPLSRTYLAIFQKGLGRLALDAIHPITTRTMTQFFSQMPMVKVEADRWKKQGATVIVLVDDAKRAQKVEQTFADFDIKSVISNGAVLEGQLQIMVGKMHNGFELPEDKFAVLTERELFNKLTKRAPRNQKNLERGTFEELHGVSRWRLCGSRESRGRCVPRDGDARNWRYPPRLHVDSLPRWRKSIRSGDSN